MIYFLAIIGLIVILWWLGKKISKAGDALVKIGDAMVDKSIIEKPKCSPENERHLRELEKRLRHTKGEVTNDEYQKEILEEIERLTKPQ